MWQRDAQWKYSCICADASDRVRVVLPWRYERWTDQDAIICRFDDPFSWGVCKYCRFPWKEAYDGRSRTCDVYGTGSGNARMDHDNICNMDQTVFFCFYLWESGDRIVFSTYFISDVEKGTER